MANRSRMPVRRSISVARKTSWAGFNFGRVDGLIADGGVLFTFGFIAGADGITLVRLRGELLMSSAMSSGDSAECAVGIMLVNDNAFNIGITAIPLPITDADDDGWLYHQWCSASAVSQSAGNRTQNFRFEIDNKAMRKVRVGQTFVAVVEMDNEVGTGVAIDLNLNCRALFKLP